ncbi:hypothetical protein BGZ95_007447, partial [Linnemannia exigua]
MATATQPNSATRSDPQESDPRTAFKAISHSIHRCSDRQTSEANSTGRFPNQFGYPVARIDLYSLQNHQGNEDHSPTARSRSVLRPNTSPVAPLSCGCRILTSFHLPVFCFLVPELSSMDSPTAEKEPALEKDRALEEKERAFKEQ